MKNSKKASKKESNDSVEMTPEEIQNYWFGKFEEVRIARKMTYEQFVRTTGISTSKGFYHDLKTNRRKLNLNHIHKVENAFDIVIISE